MRAYGLEIDRQNSQDLIQFLFRAQLVDRKLKIARTGSILVIPVKQMLSVSERAEICRRFPQARFVESAFAELTKKPRDLREAIGDGLLPNIVDHLHRSYDVVGDIGIVELDDKVPVQPGSVAEALMKLNPHLRMVVRKTTKTSGQYRTRGVEIIAGRGSTETVHREFSLDFHLDIASVYFNPRLSHERMRVAKQVREGEIVIDMFAGVGPYSILIARSQPNVQVLAIDLNPIAYKYLKENIFANKVAEKITPLLGDARQIASEFTGIADRVIMNLPSSAATFLDVATSLLKRTGGVIHYYCFASRHEEIESLSRLLRLKVNSCQRRVTSFSYQQAIKEVAPNRVQFAFDANII